VPLPSGDILLQEGDETVVMVSVVEEEIVHVSTVEETVVYVDNTWAAGADGPSAYEVAVAQGFVGTEEQWLASLRAGSVLPFAFHAPGFLTPGVLSAEYLAPWTCRLDMLRGVTGSGQATARVRVDGVAVGGVATVTPFTGSMSLSGLVVAAGARVGVELPTVDGAFNLSVTITAVTG
jgi:hypothetical protein